MTQLAADSVVFAYGARRVLDHVSVTVAAGELVGVIGPNGSGKTTLVRLLSGALRPAAGTVTLDGRRLAAIPRRELACRLAVVPQDPVLTFPFSALEVVLMGRSPHLPALALPRARDLEIARAVMTRLEIDGVATRALQHLSGGERQRVLLARALAQEPDVMLLDEPTAHLDLRHQVAIYELVRELARDRGLAAVSVLHDLNLAALYCDRLVLLADGRLVAAGPPSTVLAADVLERVYRTPLAVATNPRTGSPIVLPLPAVAGEADAG